MEKNRKIKIVSLLSNLVIICVLVVVSVFTILPSSKTVSQNENGVYYSGNPDKPYISLMVNVYWGNEDLEQMLEIFLENDIQTTFFVGGTWASKNNELLQKIKDAGHEIGNHGFFHKDQDKLDYAQNKSEILNNHNLIKELLGVEMNLFAPPSGAYSSITLDVAESLGYKTIMWSKDTIDWRDHDASLILKRATTNLSNGDLILMHPTEATVQALSDIIANIKSQGFEIVTVSKNIEETEV